MNYAEATGKTVDMAIKAAVDQLGVDLDDVRTEILEAPSKGIFGLGSKLAKVRVTVIGDDDELEAPIAQKKESKVSGADKKPEKKAEKKPEKKAEKKAAPDLKDDAKEAAREDVVCTDGDVDTVVEFLNGVFNLAGIDVNADGRIASFEDGDAICVDIAGKNTGLIIGKRGETITSLQHLASLALTRKNPKAPKVYLDSENYREKRVEALKALSNKVANNVIKSRRSFTFEPMSAYERRIIHATLQNNDKITTYSVGQGIHRKVVVALKK